jgi:1-acyl-sn-glycerol-3-phosphate acyltransferase
MRRRRGPISITLWSIWSWFWFGACVGLWIPVLLVTRLVTFPFDPARYWTGYAFRKMAVAHERLNPLWRFRVTGTMPADPRKPYVVVSNHESFVDILLICQLPFEMKWLSKAEMFKIPFAGWLMRLAGDIPVDRSSMRAGMEAMAQCRRVLDQHVSVMIFPEGTRSTTDELLPFKDGAFRLAIEAEVDVLPMVVVGTSTALRKHDWRMGESDALLHVMEPVSTAGLTKRDTKQLREQVQALIAEERARLQAERGLGGGTA